MYIGGRGSGYVYGGKSVRVCIWGKSVGVWSSLAFFCSPRCICIMIVGSNLNT